MSNQKAFRDGVLAVGLSALIARATREAETSEKCILLDNSLLGSALMALKAIDAFELTESIVHLYTSVGVAGKNNLIAISVMPASLGQEGMKRVDVFECPYTIDNYEEELIISNLKDL